MRSIQNYLRNYNKKTIFIDDNFIYESLDIKGRDTDMNVIQYDIVDTIIKLFFDIPIEKEELDYLQTYIINKIRLYKKTLIFINKKKGEIQ